MADRLLAVLLGSAAWLGLAACDAESTKLPSTSANSGAAEDVAAAPASTRDGTAGGSDAGGSSGASASPGAEAFLTSGARRAVSADGTYRVAWEPVGRVIPDAEPFAIAIEVERVDGRALASDVAIAADAEMPHHGHGMNLVPVVKAASGRGRFVAEGMLLHMPGRWIVAIDVEEDGVAERAHWIIDVE